MSQQERWQLSDSGAESYEAYQVPSVFEPLALIFLGHMPLRPGQRVLDLACGTGIVARRAAAVVGDAGQVVGVDLNEGMLQVAERQARAEGVEIDWRQGDVTALPFGDATFDIVLCQQGLQFIPDKMAALREVHRVLAPSGRVGICLWRSIEHSPFSVAVIESFSRHISPEAANRIRAPFALGDAAELRALLADAGFEDIDIRATVATRRMLPPEESIPGYIASTPVGPAFAELDDETRATIVREIGEALVEYRHDDGLAIPQGTHIAVAGK